MDSRIGDGPGGREDLRDISPARGIQHVFEALRDGDRFWYSETLLPWELEMIEQLRLSDIIRFNTEIGSEIPDDVFHVVLDSGERDGPRDRNRDRRGRDRRR